uniref:Uncharacterized protein n=1 Tax=Lactuca sativa TaxID=4236 RepID=A0A9R1WA94_LACSA|nr:hypothetical protein LSAT_V11C200080950 [Lactuca sativa]
MNGRRSKARTLKGNHKMGREKGKISLKPTNKEEREIDKDETCFDCGVKNKNVGEGTSGISMFMIEMELFTFSYNTWGFKKSRELKADEMVLHVGNGVRVAVRDLGHFDLCLPSNLYLTLDNACLIISITRNIVLVSRSRKSGLYFKSVDYNVHSFLKGIFYFEARPINGIYELNLDDTSNHKSLYHVNTKRIKQGLN